MGDPRRRHPCPVCGDPNAYPIWIDAEPPEGCPDDEAWMKGHARTIRNVTECRRQVTKAWQAAEFRRESRAQDRRRQGGPVTSRPLPDPASITPDSARLEASG